MISNPTDRGLYVSTDGFTQDACIETDWANLLVKLLNLNESVRHYAERYDSTDTETEMILPLVRIWCSA